MNFDKESKPDIFFFWGGGGGGGGGEGRGGVNMPKMSISASTVEHVVQSTFQNMLITFELSKNPTTRILSSLVSEF